MSRHPFNPLDSIPSVDSIRDKLCQTELLAQRLRILLALAEQLRLPLTTADQIAPPIETVVPRG